MRSCREVCVELVDESGSVGPEVADGPVNTSPFSEGCVVEVVWADACGHCDHLHHPVEPPSFSGAERNTGLGLLSQPPGIPLVDLLGVGHELIICTSCEPDEGDQVGESVPVAVPYTAYLDGLIGGPDQVRGPVVRGPADPVGKSLDLDEGHPAFLGLLHELDGGDLVAVVDDVLLPGLHDGPGTSGIDYAVGIQQDIDADRVNDPV